MRSSLLKLFLPLILLSLPLLLKAQVAWKDPNARTLIQFSGVVVEGDSLKPVPFTGIVIHNTNRGTISDYYGYFSFVAQAGDTIDFVSMGYKKSTFVIPDTLSTNKYSIIQVLRSDTIFLNKVVIMPWPSKEEFKDAFLRLDIPDDDLARAQKNLAQAEIKDKMIGVAMDGSLNYKNQMSQQYNKLYYAGQRPPNNLLNPLAWAKFIEAWKNGEYKKKD